MALGDLAGARCGRSRYFETNDPGDTTASLTRVVDRCDVHRELPERRLHSLSALTAAVAGMLARVRAVIVQFRCDFPPR